MVCEHVGFRLQWVEYSVKTVVSTAPTSLATADTAMQFGKPNGLHCAADSMAGWASSVPWLSGIQCRVEMLLRVTGLLVDPRRTLLLWKRAGTTPPLAFLAQALDYLDHLLAGARGVDHLVRHAHGDFLPGVRVEQALDE